MTEHRNGGAAVVETLAAHGVDTIFGIPGTHNLEMYRHFLTTGIRAVTPRHEQGAGYAAEAYARVTGRPGVVVATSGPGLTNTMTAAATGYAESQPMLILSSGMPTGAEGQDLGQLHEAKNTSAAMDQLVRWSSRVRDADEAAEAVTEAFASFTGGRPRPVHIEVPVDVLEQHWSGRPRIATKTASPQADPEAVRRAAEALTAAAQPMIIAGGGAVDAQAELTALAESLGAPATTTVNGKGVVDEAHPLSVGASIRLRAVQKAAAGSDALLVVGTELGDSDLWEGQIRGRTVIRCDIDPAQLDKNCPADHALLGDAATTVAALRDALRAGSPATPERAAALRAACREEAAKDVGPYAEISGARRAACRRRAHRGQFAGHVLRLGAFLRHARPTPVLLLARVRHAWLRTSGGRRSCDRTAGDTGRGAARRRRADVLRAGTHDACGTTASGTSRRRRQRRLPGDPGPGGSTEHPADRGRTAHPGLRRPRGRDGCAWGAYHVDG